MTGPSLKRLHTCLAGTRVKDHYLASYRQVFLNILRTQLGRRGMDHGVEGCLHLAQSVDLKQLLPMADSQLTQAEAALLDRSVSGTGFTATMSKMQHTLTRPISWTNKATGADLDHHDHGEHLQDGPADRSPSSAGLTAGLSKVQRAMTMSRSSGKAAEADAAPAKHPDDEV